MESQSRLWKLIRLFLYSFVLRYAKILAPFEYVIYEENQIGFQGRLWPSKILAYFNLKHKMERTECAPKDDFGPAQAVGRSQTRPVESLGAHSVHLHTLYLNISTKIFAIAYSYGECIIKSGRHIF